MTGRQKGFSAALGKLRWNEPEPFRILEIGILRDDSIGSEESDGWSTKYWVDFCFSVTKNRRVVGIEISPGHIETCLRFFSDRKTDISCLDLYLGDAIEIIKTMSEISPTFKFDLVYLDGPSDPDYHLSLFSSPSFMKILRPSPVILIDDAGEKDQKIIEYIEKNNLGFKYEHISTSTKGMTIITQEK